MTRRYAWRGVVALAAAALLSGCDLFGPSGPGVLDATLTSSSELGGVVLEITGPSVTGFEGQGDTRAFGAPVSAATGRHRLVLVQPGAGPMRFGIQVDDLGADPPAVTVVAATNVKNFPAPLSGVEVSVQR